LVLCALRLAFRVHRNIFVRTRAPIPSSFVVLIIPPRILSAGLLRPPGSGTSSEFFRASKNAYGLYCGKFPLHQRTQAMRDFQGHERIRAIRQRVPVGRVEAGKAVQMDLCEVVVRQTSTTSLTAHKAPELPGRSPAHRSVPSAHSLSYSRISSSPPRLASGRDAFPRATVVFAPEMSFRLRSSKKKKKKEQ